MLVTLVGMTTAATYAPKSFTSKPFMGRSLEGVRDMGSVHTRSERLPPMPSPARNSPLPEDRSLQHDRSFPVCGQSKAPKRALEEGVRMEREERRMERERLQPPASQRLNSALRSLLTTASLS